ncbi:MAG: nitroreductase/quinone reductase family protein [Pseudomonadales bacterium]
MSELEALARALASDETIDIVTTGAKTGRRRTTEIWFRNLAGRIIICGTPSANGGAGPRSRRDWLANLIAHPEFEFCLKESVCKCLPARATVIRDVADRRAIMSAPQTAWYRNQGFSLDDLVTGSPIVEVRFIGGYAALNR